MCRTFGLRKLANDLATVGVGNTRIIVKTDTEPTISDLRNELAATRVGMPMAFYNSRVGDSNSNGRVEREIRDAKGLIRTLRADQQDKIKAPVHLDSSIVPWIGRRAGYILARCRVHPQPCSACNQKTHRPMLPFGEAVMLKSLKTKNNVRDFKSRFENIV